MVATSPLTRTLKNKDIKYSTRELIHRQIENVHIQCSSEGTKDHERPGYMHIISILNYKSKLLIMLPRSCWPAIRKGTVFLSLVLFYFILLVYYFLSPPPPTLRLEYRNVLYTHLTSAHMQIGLTHIMSNQLTCKHYTLLLIVMLVLLSFSHL